MNSIISTNNKQERKERRVWRENGTNKNGSNQHFTSFTRNKFSTRKWIRMLSGIIALTKLLYFISCLALQSIWHAIINSII